MTDADFADHYQPFRSFADWSSDVSTSPLFAEFTESWLAMKSTATDEDSRAALDFVMRTAALETGAIENLYSVDRGITFTVATQGAAWQAALHQSGEDVLGHFNAQLEAFESILDVATGSKPLTEVWLRELHALTCANQSTHRVAVTVDGVQWEDRPLRLGHYKDAPNHVTLPSGQVHHYCPVEDVAPEMARLMLEVQSEKFQSASAVEQCAYLHHALTVVHPFADGNGRVARAASSVFLYRTSCVPLVVFADQSLSYRAALMEADAGRPQAFVQFIEDRALDALNLIRQRFEIVSSDDQVARLNALLTGHGGLSYAQLDEVGNRLIQDVYTRTIKHLTEVLPQGVSISHSMKSERCSFGGPYHSPPGSTGFQVRLSCSAPVDAAADFTPMLGVADDPGERYLFLVMDANRPHTPPSLRLRLDELHPAVTEAGSMKISNWVAAGTGGAISELRRGIRAGLEARGFKPESDG